MPGATSRTIRVFIIDDHRMFTQAVAAALTEEPDMEVVDTVENLASARRRLEELEVDVILLDQRLPDGQGTHAAAELRALCPGAKVVLVTAAMEPSVLNEALAAGLRRLRHQGGQHRRAGGRGPRGGLGGHPGVAGDADPHHEG